VVIVGKTPTAGPTVGKVVPEIVTVPAGGERNRSCVAAGCAGADRTDIAHAQSPAHVAAYDRAEICPPAASDFSLVKSPTASRKA